MNRRAAILAAFVAPLFGHPVFDGPPAPSTKKDPAPTVPSDLTIDNSYIITEIPKPTEYITEIPKPTEYIIEFTDDWNFTFKDTNGRSIKYTSKEIMDALGAEPAKEKK